MTRPRGLTDNQWRDEVLRRMMNTPSSAVCLNGRHKKKRVKPIHDAPSTRTTKKKCLSCDREFEAEGKFNRLCVRCK